MTWRPVGAASVEATTEEVTLGFVSAPLDAGFLKLRFRSGDGASQRPLSFGIVEPVAAVDGGGLPGGRYYPGAHPAIVALGPGVGEAFTGSIRFRPRAYNLRWLSVGLPRRFWRVEAEAWTATGQVQPWWTPGGFRRGVAKLLPSGETVGTAGAAPLINV